MEIIVIRLSKIVRMLWSILFFLIICLAIYSTFVVGDVNLWIGMLGIFVSLAYLFGFVLNKKLILVINNQGLICPYSKLIPWEQIESARLKSFMGTKMLAIKLKSPKDFISKKYLWLGQIFYPLMKGSDLLIGLDQFDKTAEEIMSIVMDRLPQEQLG
jgi:hypothetical protein